VDDPGVAVILDRRAVRDARAVTTAWMREVVLDLTDSPDGPAVGALRACAAVWDVLGEQGAPVREHHGHLTSGHVSVLEAIARAVSVRWSEYAEDAREQILLTPHPEVSGYAAERAGFLQGVSDAAARVLDSLPATA